MASKKPNIDSLTGEKTTEEQENKKNWAEKQATASAENTNKFAAGSSGTVQSYESYLKAVSDEAENGGKIPQWKVIDATSFIAAEVQKAINEVNTAADQVIAYAQLVGQAAELLASIARANASLLETAINLVRDEIKALLDGLIALGGVYVLPVPPDFLNGGGIDSFKRQFFDSLEDQTDVNRPTFPDTSAAQAVFMVMGAPSGAFLTPWKRFFEFLFPAEKRGPNGSEATTSIPSPENFSAKTLYAPVYKSPFRQDHIIELANTKNPSSISIARYIGGHVSGVSTASKLQVRCSWDMPDSLEFEPNNLDIPEEDNSSYTKITHKERKLDDGSYEFTREQILVANYVLIRSATSAEMETIGEKHPAVILALKEKRDIEPGEVGLSDNTKIFFGVIFPGFNYVSDTDIDAPDKANIKIVINSTQVPLPTNKEWAKYRSKSYYYKMAFVGFRRKYKIKYKPLGGTNWGVWYGNQKDYEKTPANPYSIEPYKTVGIDAIGDLAAEDVFGFFIKVGLSNKAGPSSTAEFFAAPEPLYDFNDDSFNADGSKSRWLMSGYSQIITVTNETISSPSASPSPNWYSLKLIDLIPPLKRLIDEMKRFIDMIADSLIEGLAGLLAVVEALVAEIQSWVAWIIKLMELIKSLLIPPMAGVHVLSLETNRGMAGIKEQFSKSFSVAPRANDGGKNYPDEYIKYGQRVNKPGRMQDIGGPSGQKLLPGNNEGKEGKTASGGFVVGGLSVKSFQDNAKAAASEAAGVLFGGKDDRGKRKSEPSDEDMRKLGVPMYDSNHFTGGFIFVFESVSAFVAFTKLLNLQNFIRDETEKTRKQLIGVQAFDQIKFPNLANFATLAPNRQNKLKERLAAFDVEVSQDDSASSKSEADHNAGITPPPLEVGEVNRTANLDPDGNQHVLTPGKEPFVFNELPAVLTFVVNGITFSVIIGKKASGDNDPTSLSFSAQALADMINAAYREAVAKALKGQGLTDAEIATALASLAPLVSATDGFLSFKTPPASVAGAASTPSKTTLGAGASAQDLTGKFILGNGARTLKVGGSSAALGKTLAPGKSFKGVNLGQEVKTLEAPLPLRTGDFVVECEGDNGIPTPDQVRTAPAIYRFGAFFEDPELQDLGPERCHLLVQVDAIPLAPVDVTGNLGANPKDASPVFYLERRNGDPLEFPLSVDATGHKFLFEVNGDFRACQNITGCKITNFKTLATTTVNFFTEKVKTGDRAHLKYSDLTEFSTEIVDVDNFQIKLLNGLYLEDTVELVKITRRDLPAGLDNNFTPKFSEICSLPVSADVQAISTYATLLELKQALNQALQSSGLEYNSVLLEDIDTSVAQDGSRGRLKVSLKPAWGYGDTSSIKISSPGFVGASAAIQTGNLSTAFPLVVDQSKRSFMLKLFGAPSPAPTAPQQITIPEGTYSLGQYVLALQSAIDAVGLGDIKVANISGELRFYINSFDNLAAPLAEHYSYSEKVTLTLKQVAPMDPNTATASFPVGVPLPPTILTPDITFPLAIGVGYRDIFYIQVTPVVGTRPTGPQPITIAPNNYSSASELAQGVQDGLTKAGFISGSAGFVRCEAEGAKLRFTVKPEAVYTTSLAQLSISNNRASAPTLTTGFLSFGEMRDYSYEKIFTWLSTNITSLYPPGFPTPAPQAFLGQVLEGGVVAYTYTGSLTLTSSNNKFNLHVSTNAVGYLPSTVQVITVATGTYANLTALAVAVQTAVNAVFPVNSIIVTVSSTTLLNFKASSVALKAAYTQLLLTQNGVSPFVPAPYSSILPAYNGTWVVAAGVNDSFEMKITTPVVSVLSDWQVITIPPATYSTFASVITAIQTAVNTKYGASTVTVSSTGVDQVKLELSHATARGIYSTLETRQNGDKLFVAMGAATAGSTFGSAVGTGDVRLLEAIGMADTSAIGRNDLLTTLGVMVGLTNFDNIGLPSITASGTNDYNLLRVLNLPYVEAFGTYKVPYTLTNVVNAINAHFAGVNANYGSIAEDYLDRGILRLSGIVRSKKGYLKIVALSQALVAGSAESALVAQQLFGFSPARLSDVEVFGIGRLMTASTFVVQLEDEGALEYELVFEGDNLLTQGENDFYVTRAEIEPDFGYITEIERAQ